MPRYRLPVEKEAEFWDWVREGKVPDAVPVLIGVSTGSCFRWLADRGGVKPPVGYGRSKRYLTFAEREEIAVCNAEGLSVRAIAKLLGRSPSTISRELRRAPRNPNNVRPSRPSYRAGAAQEDADLKRKRARGGKLACNERLRCEVQERLNKNHSPEQISCRLRADFPDQPEMWVSHETIYKALYVQGRGELKRELVRHLRTGRSLRKPRRTTDKRPGRIPGMVNISKRPKEATGRAVPGHWEGDLILGKAGTGSAIGTLVERASRFTLLLHFPGKHTAEEVADAMITKIHQLPEQLRMSLTWDQGREMAQHERITDETGMEIYFCDPHSPWQRGTNENTNGLLRQYFPKSTDLSQWGPGYLDTVAAELNSRPRKTLEWETPAERLVKLLNQDNTPGVATTT